MHKPDLSEMTGVNLRGMVTLKCWGSEINSFLLSSFKPTPAGPTQKQTSKHGIKMTEVTESIKISLQSDKRETHCHSERLSSSCRGKGKQQTKSTHIIYQHIKEALQQLVLHFHKVGRLKRHEKRLTKRGQDILTHSSSKNTSHNAT